MTADNNNSWIMKAIVLGFGGIIITLIGAGYSGLMSGLTRIENTQMSMKMEFLEKTKEAATKVDLLCQKIDKHDAWLRVPFSTRQEYFLKHQKNEK